MKPTVEPASTPRGLQAKLVRSIVILIGSVGIGLLLLVALLLLWLSNRNSTELEDQIGKTLISKGRTLADGQAVTFKGLATENALTDMHNALVNLRSIDDDIAYGLFVGPKGQPWAYTSATRPSQLLGPDSPFPQIRAEAVASDIGISPSALLAEKSEIRKLAVAGQEVWEFTAPVVDAGRLVGTLRIGVSTRRMRDSLGDRRRTESAALKGALAFVGILLLGALAVGVLGALRTARRIATPIAELTDAAERLALGERQIQVQIRSHDELEALGEAFNRMVSDLDASYSALADKHEALLKEVDERRRAEAERTELEGHLIQAQKMEAFGQLAGGVAHDFNNILHVILAHAGLLSDAIEEGLPREELIESAETIATAAKRGSHLTRQLLTFARRQQDRPVSLDLNALVRGFDKMVRRMLEENIELRFEFALELPTVCADPGRIEQVLMNLCVNARDAMAGGGTLTVATSRVELHAPHPTITGIAPAGAYAVLRASDTGTGMTTEVMTRIFEPFFTTKPTGRGTGLGLATVHGIVRAANGYIDAKSEIGKGTSFFVYLPASQGDTAFVVEEKGDPVVCGNREHILVCEDEDSARAVTVHMLVRHGYRVTAAETAARALEVLEAEPVALLLTDVVMPGMSGPELATRARARLPGLRVLYMSGYIGEVLASQGLLEEGVNLLPKPFQARDLIAYVRRVVDERHHRS